MRSFSLRSHGLLGCALLALSLPGARAADVPSSSPGLLFYVSGDHGTTADVAAPGTAEPSFVNDVTTIPDGAKGPALQCADLQRLAWWAPGNIYAQRGTLSFFWRSRYPVGPTQFPVFRVGFGDHSSWDMVWLRIDYNGHGFDAFVTDASLARIRVSVPMDPFPGPKVWTHLAISWDERGGIRFYINGKLAAKNETVAVLNTSLDQFGPHSRIISPHNVQSDYNYVRGGDIDELRIYDRMLTDENIVTLATGDAPVLLNLSARSLADAQTRDEWNLRYGFNRPNDAPPALPAGPAVTIRKVEIHDAYDIKRWWWKATDGIRETTWPGVYNRSRLPGRNDYFQLPDWDCYVDSGKAITFVLPDEPWNHLEISGAAWGKMELLPVGTENEAAYAAKAEATLFERPKGEEKTIHTFTQPLAGRKIRFTNVAQEEPISELAAYNVTAGAEPAGSTKLAYRISATSLDGLTGGDSLKPLAEFISGRFPADERAAALAVPATAYQAPATGATSGQKNSLPLVHVLLPNTWDNLSDGLDGIALDLPALKLKPTHGGLIALNIQVKDPLWPMRDMLDFTFSVKPGEAKTLWLDLRDRLLPPGKGLYLTIASASSDFAPASLEGAGLRLVFKPRAAALAEHELDRFTQVKDNYAMLVEEHPHSPNLKMWVRFQTDLKDLLRANPQHELGRLYAAASGEAPPPAFTQPNAPDGVPLWAFRQTELLGYVKRFVVYYVDHRQSDFGDFGGGISDDVDLVNTWPGVALMGCEPDKLKLSLHRLLDAAVNNGMFTNGICTIQADELHSYEEGIDNLAANMIFDYGNPLQIERAMATSRGVESITGVNAAGHRHIMTSYYNGKKMATDDPWGYAKAYSYLVCQVPQQLVDFNGSPEPKKYLLELADGLLAHRKQGENGRYSLPSAIHFIDDKDATSTRAYFPWHMFWGAWKWTNDPKYLAPIMDTGVTSLATVNPNLLDILDLRKTLGSRFAAGERAEPAESRPKDGRGKERTSTYRASNNGHIAWQMTGDKSNLENLYAAQIQECAQLDYINTVGSLWIDRVGVPYADLQRARLGGVALVRNSLYPGHVVGWRFAAPANDQSVAILIPNATPTGFKVIAYNLETTPVQATMTGWNIDPGVWEITQGVDTKNDDNADQSLETRTAVFERSRSLQLTLPPRATTVLTLKLKTPGTPYWSRPDLGISSLDVSVSAGQVHVKVHSLGSVPAPASSVAVRDAAGHVLATSAIPALAAPIDLVPKTADVVISLPAGSQLTGGSVELDPDHQFEEITEANNVVHL
jgi:hypothetical protein